jgi:(2R)-ethylmalonyl-CoA mutase
MGVADPERSEGRDRPWVFRTYSGHTSARASNELYRANLAKGQTGLSVAFDLPTQTGYDADHALARGEVGKVGVPISTLEDMDALFAGIPLDQMNTSMTINATAAWLLALYVAVAENHGVDPHALEGTTQNDLIKEFLSRGTYVFPPEPSMRLISDMVAYSVDAIPRWNRSTSAATTCRRRARRRCRRSRTPSPTRSPCSTRCAHAKTCPRTRCRACSGASRSS